MILVRWRPSSWMKFPRLFFFNLSWHEPTTDDRSDEFPDGWLPSNHSTYGVCECKHAISSTPKEKKSHGERSGERGGHGTSPKREMRCRETCFVQWSLARLQCVLWHHLVETTHWHSLFFFGAVLSTTDQKMSGSRGSPCTYVNVLHMKAIYSLWVRGRDVQQAECSYMKWAHSSFPLCEQNSPNNNHIGTQIYSLRLCYISSIFVCKIFMNLILRLPHIQHNRTGYFPLLNMQEGNISETGG